MSYTNRSIEAVTVDKVHDDGRTVTWTNGWTFGGIPAEHQHLLCPGAEFLSETVRLTQVTGMATTYRTTLDDPVVDRWLWHKTDAELEAEHAEMVAGFDRENEARWEANRIGWLEREALLPLTLRRRLDRFRANGGHEFEISGWGYELVCCELAELYAASGQEDTEAISAYARTNGTSGNQHDYARMLSRHLTGDVDDADLVANSPSALTPLTGNADYTTNPDATSADASEGTS